MAKRLISLYSRHKNLISLTILIILVFIFIAPLFYNIENTSHNTDWGSHFSVFYFSRLSILKFKQFPLWSGHLGGGYPIIAHIEEASLTPNLFLMLLFGEIIGAKLMCALLYITGAIGMFYLTKHIFKYTSAGAFFSVFVFLTGDLFPLFLASGDPKQLHFLLYPLMLAFFIKSQENKKFLFYCSLLLTVLIFEADFVALLFLLFLALYLVGGLLKKREEKLVFNITPFKNFFLLIILSLLIGAVKILPLMKILNANPRTIVTYDISAIGTCDLITFLQSLSIRSAGFLISGFYIGLFPVIICVLCFILFWKKLKYFLLPLVVFTWIYMGPHVPIDLWKLFRQLPFFFLSKRLRTILSYCSYLHNRSCQR